MTITITAKDIRKGDRIQGLGQAVAELPVNRVFHATDENGEYPEVELGDGSSLPIRSWGTKIRITR